MEKELTTLHFPGFHSKEHRVSKAPKHDVDDGLGVSAQNDELPQRPLWKAFERFSNSVDSVEKTRFNNITFDDVLVSFRTVDRQHFSSSKLRLFSTKLEPVLRFLDRHARALDSMTQVYPNPSALIWGLMRVFIESALSFSRYFKEIVDMMEKLGASLSQYSEYERLLGNSQRFQEALADVYFDVLVFLKKARAVFQAKPLMILFRSVWRNFETDFEETQRSIQQHASHLEQEITLSYRSVVLRGLEKQSIQVSTINKQLYENKDYLERQKIVKWLSPLDMEEVRYRESQRCTQACGRWLLGHEAFTHWLCGCNRLLWISGPPGSGKSVLSTVVIESIKNQISNPAKQAIAFFFCDKADEKYHSSTTILSTLIAQVLAQTNSVPDNLRTPYSISERYGRSTISSSDQPTKILKGLASTLENLFIVIDGMDEFLEPSCIVETFKTLTEGIIGVQTLFLSRDTEGLRTSLRKTPRIHLTSALVKEDIDKYLHKKLGELALEDESLRSQVYSKLSNGSDGMFLWAHLMIQSLKSALCTAELQEVLSDLPAGLDTLHSAALNKIAKGPPKKCSLAKKVLQWICCAARPLHWCEVEVALAFDQSSLEFLEDKKPFKSAVLELTGSLFEYGSHSDLFRLLHLSVREFLLSSPESQPVHEGARKIFINEKSAHLDIAKTCIAYQLHYGVPIPSKSHAQTLPLAQYSARFWCHHVCNALYSAELHNLVDRFLSVPLRRQVWITTFLFWEPSAFPLQHLIKLQKMLGKWMTASQECKIQNDILDWIRDVPTILLGAANLERENQSTGRGNLDSFEMSASPMSFFEKLMVIRDLSREYTMAGSINAGERWLTDLLAMQRKACGPSHISTAWLMNALGIIYDQQQNTVLSARTQELALEIQKANLGPNHLETIWTVNELGRIYRHLGKFEKAESMHLQALGVLSKILQPGDLQIAWTLNTLARTYRRQGRFGEAIRMHEEALASQREALGELHPHTLWATMDKAACYRGQGRLAESIALYEKAMEGRKTVLGLKHADTLWAMNNYGLIFADLGLLESAIKIHRQALSGQEEVLGPIHKHTQWTKDTITELSEALKKAG